MIKNKQNYMNNPNLPTVGAEFEYTPKMVKELKKCEKNILHLRPFRFVDFHKRM